MSAGLMPMADGWLLERGRLATTPRIWAGVALPISVSVGGAELGHEEDRVTAALQRTDRISYLAKSQGCNCSKLTAVEAAGAP